MKVLDQNSVLTVEDLNVFALDGQSSLVAQVDFGLVLFKLSCDVAQQILKCLQSFVVEAHRLDVGLFVELVFECLVQFRTLLGVQSSAHGEMQGKRLNVLFVDLAFQFDVEGLTTAREHPFFVHLQTMRGFVLFPALHEFLPRFFGAWQTCGAQVDALYGLQAADDAAAIGGEVLGAEPRNLREQMAQQRVGAFHQALAVDHHVLFTAVMMIAEWVLGRLAHVARVNPAGCYACGVVKDAATQLDAALERDRAQ